MRFLKSLAVSLWLLIASCAHDPTQHLSNAPDLFSFLSDPKPSGPGCPAWVKLEDSIDSDSAADFVATMKACADRAVVIEINSPGGNVFAALEVQKAIERHPHLTYCVVDGMAASAAFVTLQSCSVRLMTDRSVLMAHEAAGACGGQPRDVDNCSAALRAVDRALALHCAKRMGMSPDEYMSHTSGGKEWWLGLEAARAFNAVDQEVPGVGRALELAGVGAPNTGPGSLGCQGIDPKFHPECE